MKYYLLFQQWVVDHAFVVVVVDGKTQNGLVFGLN